MKLLSFPRLLGDRFRDAYAANPRRLRLAFLATLTVVVALMSMKYAAKISKPGDRGEQSRSAFLRWRGMINAVFAGENIYVGLNEYPNPPIMAIVLKPFASLPPVIGALAWFYAKVLLAVLSCAWAFRLAGGKVEDPTPGPLPQGERGRKWGVLSEGKLWRPPKVLPPLSPWGRGPGGGVFPSTSPAPRRSSSACPRCWATCRTTT